ncbi:hypothetical protein UY3_01311 [Chelonia mydas]|uniref:Amino acid transporter transmembrane domain-containing protein n=1 Tax=Chelonia mydas TaxID=8469 RepID=M7BZZ6_CHEMY|nr:hypothetical protein UY3_01311 [Chelonia mydas]
MEPAHITLAIRSTLNTTRIIQQYMQHQNLAKRNRASRRRQRGDKSDEDVDTDFSQSTGPGNVGMVLMGQVYVVEGQFWALGNKHRLVGMMYVFNSMFGIGILALPKAFADAGWLASSVILALAMVMSYITVTFLIEVMSSANARVVWDRNNDCHKEDEILKENIPMSAKRGEESTKSKALHSESSSKHFCCCYCLPDDPKPSVFDISELLSLTDLTKMYFSTVHLMEMPLKFILVCCCPWKSLAVLLNGSVTVIVGLQTQGAQDSCGLQISVPRMQKNAKEICGGTRISSTAVQLDSAVAKGPS